MMNVNQQSYSDVSITTIARRNLSVTQSLSTIGTITPAPVSRIGELVVGVIAYSIIILLSVIGNVIVVTAICRVQRLRHPTNFILMSLAIADLLVTTTVMIPGFIYEIKGKWIFGPVFCNIWVANDITFCTASILHLVAVSFDRYVAIENPLKYKQKMTKRTIFIIIGCIWLISVLLSYGPVLLGVYSQAQNDPNATANATFDPESCQMRPNVIYSIVSSSTSFYIPLIIILFLYGRIFVTAHKHSHELQKLENIIKRLHSNEKFVLESSKWKKNMKAIRTLGIVVGVFVACWLPFFVMYIIMACCKHKCVSATIERYITWIGYANSFCNPVIYAFSNKEFRNAFFEILHYNNCRCVPLSSNSKIRTSISKSTYSMNTRMTPPVYSRQTSVVPFTQQQQQQRNGYLSHETSPSSYTFIPKILKPPKKSESRDTFELQPLPSSSNQRTTREVFNELEHLVPNGATGRASIVQMSSLLYDQDDITVEQPSHKRSMFTSRLPRS